MNKINGSFEDINFLKKINNYKNKVPQKITKDELTLVSGYIYKNLLKLKFENSINDKIYDDFAAKLLAGKIDQKTLKKLDTLRRKHNEIESKKWQEIKKKKATRMGLNFRNILRQVKKS